MVHEQNISKQPVSLLKHLNGSFFQSPAQEPWYLCIQCRAEPTAFNSPYLHSPTHSSLGKKKKKKAKSVLYLFHVKELDLKSLTLSKKQQRKDSQGREAIWHHLSLNSLASKQTQFN